MENTLELLPVYLKKQSNAKIAILNLRNSTF